MAFIPGADHGEIDTTDLTIIVPGPPTNFRRVMKDVIIFNDAVGGPTLIIFSGICDDTDAPYAPIEQHLLRVSVAAKMTSNMFLDVFSFVLLEKHSFYLQADATPDDHFHWYASWADIEI